MSPSAFIAAAWIVWLFTWILAAGWSARTASHHDLGAESPSRVLTLAAVVMILASYWPLQSALLWRASLEVPALFTEIGEDQLRLISAREAKPKEQRAYERNTR